MQFTINALALLLAATATALPTASSTPQRRQSGTVSVGGACDFGDCLPGLSCRGFDITKPKTCSRNNGNGQLCAVDDDCHSGVCAPGENGGQGAVAFQCFANRNGLETRQAGTVGIGGVCDFGDCLPGLRCRGFSNGPKTCSRNNGAGAFCAVNDDCASGSCGLGSNGGSQGATLLQCL